MSAAPFLTNTLSDAFHLGPEAPPPQQRQLVSLAELLPKYDPHRLIVWLHAGYGWQLHHIAQAMLTSPEAVRAAVRGWIAARSLWQPDFAHPASLESTRRKGPWQRLSQACLADLLAYRHAIRAQQQREEAARARWQAEHEARLERQRLSQERAERRREEAQRHWNSLSPLQREDLEREVQRLHRGGQDYVAIGKRLGITAIRARQLGKRRQVNLQEWLTTVQQPLFPAMTPRRAYRLLATVQALQELLQAPRLRPAELAAMRKKERELEAARLRKSGLKLRQVGAALGVGKARAGQMVASAWRRWRGECEAL